MAKQGLAKLRFVNISPTSGQKGSYIRSLIMLSIFLLESGEMEESKGQSRITTIAVIPKIYL